MSNKIVIVILALLVIIAGGIGYYSYTLDRQIDRLGDQLASFETEQAVRMEAINSEIVSLRTDTQAGIEYLKEKIADAKTDISAMKSRLGAAEESLAGLEEAVGAIDSQVENLDERIGRAEAEISGALVNAGKVYEEVSRVTVRITNGDSAVGSGFIYDDEGHVVTACHVAKGLSRIYVMLDDGRISPATTVGYCEFSDVAVLSLETEPDIAPPVIGDSSLVHVGDAVIAIGSPGESDNPLGLKDTLTAGVLSQVNRSEDIEGSYVANLLQFDAAVNFGNSGGPLANARGEIIGLVIARIDPIRGDGINWAVSSNKFRRVAEAIIESGSYDYPWIGTGIADLTPQMVRDKSLETANGVLVGEVVAGSPAEEAGLETGDVIVAADGVPIEDTGQLTSYLGEYKSPGDEIVLDIIRGSGTVQIFIEVGRRQP
jgi:S1-C subfamily serine protease